MRRYCIVFLFTHALGASISAQQTYQLAPPFVSYPSVFFAKEGTIAMRFAMQEAVIRYTTDGRLPTMRDSIYHHSLRITDNITTVSARTFAEGFLPSDPVQVTFIKEGHPIRSVTSLPAPSLNYPGSGPSTLHDRIGGITTSLGTWWGFDSDSVQLTVTLQSPAAIKQVLVHMLQQQGSWIFLPLNINVTLSDQQQPGEVIADQSIDALRQENRTQCIPIVITPARPVTTAKLLITLHRVKSLPEWHSGKGQHAWIFIDEIEIF